MRILIFKFNVLDDPRYSSSSLLRPSFPLNFFLLERGSLTFISKINRMRTFFFSLYQHQWPLCPSRIWSFPDMLPVTSSTASYNFKWFLPFLKKKEKKKSGRTLLLDTKNKWQGQAHPIL